MRKIFWIALVALGASSAPIGSVQAENEAVVAGQAIDQATLEQIYEAVACETGMYVDEVREAHAEGRVEVVKEADGYRVTVLDGGGTILEVTLEDDL